MAVELLPDELWQEIEPLLPPPPPPSPKGGRPPVDNRAALRGILFVNRTGIPWQALPAEVFGVSGSSCWRRFREWTAAGIWPRLHKRLLDRLGRCAGVNQGHEGHKGVTSLNDRVANTRSDAMLLFPGR